MIKRTEINQQKTPTVMKNKNPYSNKGSVPLKSDAGTFDANTTPKPGMGKGKARGMGAAEFGGKFSGVYQVSVVWISQKFLKELEAQREGVKDTILAGAKDFAQYQYLLGRYSSLVEAENTYRELLGRIEENDEDTRS